MAMVVSGMAHPDFDIHAVFSLYSSLYFERILDWCSVKWSDSTMTSFTGTLFYPEGSCEVILSTPLLRNRSIDDVKNTLLHQMIHAYLYIAKKRRNHNAHGKDFVEKMNSINSSTVGDFLRPRGGYNITLLHDFHDDVDNDIAHTWTCESCNQLIKRATPAIPSHRDCIMKAHYMAKSCGNSKCPWHSHKEKCSGTYKKLSGPLENQESTQIPSSHSDNRGKSVERFSNTNSKAKENSLQFSSSSSVRNSSIVQSNLQQDKKGKSVIQETKPFKIFTRRPRKSPQISQSISQSNGQDSARPNKETANLLSPTSPNSSRKRRFHTESNHGSNQQGVNRTEHKVVSKWLNYYEDEVTDEEIEPLVNKRSEMRKRIKTKREDEMERISGLLCMQSMEEREVPLLCLHGPGFSQEEALEISDDD